MIYWWIFFWAQVVSAIIAFSSGAFHLAAKADISHIAFVILALQFGTTIWLGVMTSRTARFPSFNFHEDTGWFLSESAMMLGMIGTIIGFIYTLVTTLGSGIEASQLNTVIQGLAHGIGTAGWTTLFGLIASLSIKIQMNNLEALRRTQE